MTITAMATRHIPGKCLTSEFVLRIAAIKP
jgi:hypothetical protein